MIDILRPDYKKIISHYGTRNQLIQAVSELAELTDEINTFLLSERLSDNMASEIGDTINMINQIMIIFDLENEVKKVMLTKTSRQLLRMEKEL